MGLFDRLFGRPGARRSDDLAELRGEIAQLRAQVRDLDALQVSREMTFRELSDKALKYLKRVQELDRREQLENGAGDDDVLGEVLRRKFPRRN